MTLCCAVQLEEQGERYTPQTDELYAAHARVVSRRGYHV